LFVKLALFTVLVATKHQRGNLRMNLALEKDFSRSHSSPPKVRRPCSVASFGTYEANSLSYGNPDATEIRKHSDIDIFIARYSDAPAGQAIAYCGGIVVNITLEQAAPGRSGRRHHGSQTRKRGVLMKS
jgi:hypothetical protein